MGLAEGEAVSAERIIDIRITGPLPPDELRALALLLVRAYGGRALAYAVERATEALEVGDELGRDQWASVQEAVRDELRGPR